MTDEGQPGEGGQLARQQEMLVSFVESVGSELELRPLLDRLLEQACRLIGADDGTIGLVDSNESLIRVEAACCMGPNEVGSEYLLGVGLAGRVLEKNDVVVVERYSDQPSSVVRADNAVIGLPIRWKGDMIGFFGVGRLKGPDGIPPKRFDDGDIHTLQLFARHAAIAIDNARRYLREQERGERLELIARIGTLITADLSQDDVLQAAADSIHDLLGYPNVGIGVLRDGDLATLTVEAMAGEFDAENPRSFPLSAGDGIMGACARERRPIRVDDVAADPRYRPSPGVEGIRGLVSLPILVGDEILGVLNVESDDPFDDEEVAGLGIVADQLAVALQNLRLYGQAQVGAALAERHRIARDLHDSVTQHLFGTVMLAESLEGVWERDPAQGKARAARVLELSRAALSEMRALLAELRPSGGLETRPQQSTFGVQRIRAFGLAGALDRLAEDVRKRGLPVEISTEGYAASAFEVEEAVYRIVQEALNNTVRHAHASGAVVTLTMNEDGLRLTVVDDGRGMESALTQVRPSGGRGYGLVSMRERAAGLGGDFRLTTTPGSGMRVEVCLPTTQAVGLGE